MNRKGFTLIELLVVIAIIGLLSTLAVVALGSARVKARDSKRLSDLKQLQTALELYYTDNAAYPNQANIALGSANYACLNASGFTTTGCANPYMALVPVDPKSGNYTYSAAGNAYTITATLEGNVNNFVAGSLHVSPAGIQQP